MTYNYRTKGVCSKEMHIELNDDHTIKSVEVIGGCNGNLQGISRLVEGMKAEDAIARMRGIRCGFRIPPAPISSPSRWARRWRRTSSKSSFFARAVHRTGKKCIKSCKMPFPSLDKRR